MSNDAAPMREGAKIMDTLPGKGPWELRTCGSGCNEMVIALCPTEQPRFYRDGKLIQVGLQVVT